MIETTDSGQGGPTVTGDNHMSTQPSGRCDPTQNAADPHTPPFGKSLHPWADVNLREAECELALLLEASARWPHGLWSKMGMSGNTPVFTVLLPSSLHCFLRVML